MLADLFSLNSLIHFLADKVLDKSLGLQIQFRVLDHLAPLVMLGMQERIKRRRRTANWFDHLPSPTLSLRRAYPCLPI